MSFFNIRPEIQQKLAIFVPLIALVLSLFVVYPAWGHYGELARKVEAQRHELEKLKAAPDIARDPVAPAADDVPTEAPQFFGQMKALAAEARCEVKVDAGSPDKVQNIGAVRSVRGRVDMDASYIQVRDFLFRLSHANRLFAVTDLSLTKATGGGRMSVPAGPLHATIEIERYVIPSAKPAG